MGIKLEIPYDEARRLVDVWKQRAMQLEGELAELTTAIASADAQLAGNLPKPKEADIASPQSRTPSGKRKKGENIRILQSYLKGLDGKGATVAEISKNTEVMPTSIHAVFNKHKGVFAKGHDGLWKLK